MKPHGDILLVPSSLSSLDVRSNKKGKSGRRDTFLNRKKERGLESTLFTFSFSIFV